MNSASATAAFRRAPTSGISARSGRADAILIEVGVGSLRQEDRPRPAELGARLIEGRRSAADILAWLRSRIEAAAPAPRVFVNRDAGPHRNRCRPAHRHRKSASFRRGRLSIGGGEGGHGAIEARRVGSANDRYWPVSTLSGPNLILGVA